MTQAIERDYANKSPVRVWRIGSWFEVKAEAPNDPHYSNVYLSSGQLTGEELRQMATVLNEAADQWDEAHE